MNKWLSSFCVVLFCVPVLANERTSFSTVTIPLNEYLALKKTGETPSFSSVESVQVSGEYKSKLEMKVSGGASLPAQEVALMQASGNIDVTECKGSAVLLVRDGFVHLIAQEKRFSISCQLRVKNWNDIRLRFQNVLSVTTNIKGAEPTIAMPEQGVREVILYRAERKIASEAPEEEPSLTAAYKVQLLPDENRFQYRLVMNNPNSKVKTMTFMLHNKEVIQKINTSLQYQDTNGKLTFTLPPGDHLATINGRLPQDGFKTPIGKGVEYLLLDQHPLLTSKIETSARRVSPSSTGLSGSFPAARGYLLSGKDELQWTKQTLETFAATTYTIKNAEYRYYWSPIGKNLVEATFWFNNQGATEIPLTLPGKPTYLAINNQPQVLSRNANQQLLLRVPTGDAQTATVQYQLDNEAPSGFASLSDSLTRPESTMTNVGVTLNIPKGFKPFFATNGVDHDWRVSLGNFVWALLAFLICYKLLMQARLTHWESGLAGCGVFVLTAFEPSFFIWSLVIATAVTAIRRRGMIMKFKPSSFRDYFKATLAVSVLFALVYIIATTSGNFMRAMNSSESLANQVVGFDSSMMGSSIKEQGFMMRAPAAGSPRPPAKKMARGGAGAFKFDASAPPPPSSEIAAEVEMTADLAGNELPQGADNYQGLPAKIEMPQDGYPVYFRTGLVDSTSVLKLRAFVIPEKVLTGLYYLALALFAFVIWRERKTIWNYIKTEA